MVLRRLDADVTAATRRIFLFLGFVSPGLVSGGLGSAGGAPVAACGVGNTGKPCASTFSTLGSYRHPWNHPLQAVHNHVFARCYWHHACR
jgi:hypothetical protein